MRSQWRRPWWAPSAHPAAISSIVRTTPEPPQLFFFFTTVDYNWIARTIWGFHFLQCLILCQRYNLGLTYITVFTYECSLPFEGHESVLLNEKFWYNWYNSQCDNLSLNPEFWFLMRSLVPLDKELMFWISPLSRSRNFQDRTEVRSNCKYNDQRIWGTLTPWSSRDWGCAAHFHLFWCNRSKQRQHVGNWAAWWRSALIVF